MLYGLLHLTGYNVTLDDIKQFRQWGSRTPGHPEAGLTPGVEATTGPLGQGLANAVGMAMAERYLAGLFNRPGHNVIDHYTYTLVGDGCLMEGIASEACSLAGHLGLSKLICLYDANDVTLDGPLSMAFSEEVGARFRSYGWHVQTVKDGNIDLNAVDSAIRNAKAETKRPSLIIVKTTIGFGSPNKQGTSRAHGSPLGPKEVEAAKQAWGVPSDRTFHIPEQVLSSFRTALSRGSDAQEQWNRAVQAWRRDWPSVAKVWDTLQSGKFPYAWADHMPSFETDKRIATRESGGKILNAIAESIPWLIGGDADLSSSTKTAISGATDFKSDNPGGRNVHFGVREHAMAGIANGMAYHGGVRPYVSTFFVFADYMRPSIRLAAMSHLPVVLVFTHDSIAVGEDGPTHQPVEHLASLRCIPNLVLLRPADAWETAEAWKVALERTDGPTALVLTRQAVPTLGDTWGRAPSGVRRGAYVLGDSSSRDPDATLIASGSEVHVCLEAQKLLLSEGLDVRVVSMPSWELFAAQPQAYQDSVLPPRIALRVAVEAATPFGWERWVGPSGMCIGISGWGASAPAEVVMEKYGFTPQAVARKVRYRLTAGSATG